MDCINYVVKTSGKKHKSKWFQASLNATEKLGSKTTVHCVNAKLALMSLNVEHCRFKYQV